MSSDGSATLSLISPATLENFARQLSRGKFLSWSHRHDALRVIREFVHAKPTARRRISDAYTLIKGKRLSLSLPAVHYQCTSDEKCGGNARSQYHSLVHVSFSLVIALQMARP
jgi:hypothetical protein